MSKISIPNEVIEQFLAGTDPQKYIVAVEAPYNRPFATIVVNDPETGKRLEDHPFRPFFWFKHEATSILYEGKRLKTIEACKRYGIKITGLKISDDEGNVPARLENGYRYLATCSKTYNDLVSFFKEGGIDVFHKDFSSMFLMFSPAEQFLIQTGKRLFKGMDDYNDIHRLQFDLETEGLNPKIHAIFQIGIKDNRNFETILETTGDSPQARRDSERLNIQRFFQIIDMLKPDVIAGFYSENFDWDFFFQRCERLSIPITELAKTLSESARIKRKAGMIKLGGESEPYMQTSMYGYNIIDICHSVRRAMAINSDIQSWSLKYITKYSEIAKPNRVYVPGNSIHTTWADKSDFAFDNANGDWYKITSKTPLREGYEVVKGNYIVQRYLLDDLWETEKVDVIFNQATFLIAKLLPTTYQRASTMGTSGQWKLIMSAWSYQNNLAIPSTEKKRDFTGGLSRLLEVGYSPKVVKFDYAALYPKTELTHGIFPSLDISGAMAGMLTYVVDTRDHFKNLTTKHKEIVNDLKDDLKANKGNYSAEKIAEIEKDIAKNSELKNLYDKKQLPLKILANSWFGSYGAPYIFNWGETDCAEETTCRGRQYLRLMVRHFTDKYGFRALVGDTDGFNFAVPDNIDEVKYVANGTHWKTTENAGKELTGLDAVLAEFNEEFMIGRMGLDIDDICEATINFSRKNYANLIRGKVKLVGNSVKNKKMPAYIEEFLNKGIRMLLEGKGQEFIEYYYEYVNKIYNYNIPLVKIASKSKVNASMADYKKKATQKNKAGKPMPKQAHMELAINAGLDVNLGDMIYYVNTGTAKSHGDLKTVTDKETGVVTVQLNCKLIDNMMLERDTELIKELEVHKKSIAKLIEDGADESLHVSLNERISEIETSLATDEYNVARYLAAFNKKIEPLLVCFDPEIRGKILLTIKKDKKDKVEKLQERPVFTSSQCKLVSGKPNKEKDQDDYILDLMTMEDKEIKFWDKVNMLPNNMEQEEWDTIRVNYHTRMREAKIDGIANEKEKLEDIFKHLELLDFTNIEDKGILPIDVLIIADVDSSGEPFLVSRKWGEKLCPLLDIFKYKNEAKERAKFYIENGLLADINKYEAWLNYRAEQLIMTGQTLDVSAESIDSVASLIIDTSKDVVLPVEQPVKKTKKKSEDDEDDDEEEEDEETVKEEISDFLPEYEMNAYLDEIGPVHVANRPNIKVYPTHVPIETNTAVMSPVSQKVEEEDDWGF